MFGDNGPVLVEPNSTSDSFGASADAASITIPSTELLFHGDFKRAGNDLKIVGSDGKAFIVHDYFKTDKPPALFAPNGASLTGEIVAALAGPLAPGQFAQVGAPVAGNAQPIGHVVTVSGNATAVRNGVAVALNVGDAIYKGDVVQTTADSALGVIFADNSTFNLGANARMVLNEFVYDPNGSANAAAISLVQGTISFLAGTIAHTGDMKVGTPVGTMGIRGTAVNVTISANDGATQISVMAEADNLTHSVNVYAPPTAADLAAGHTVGALLGVVTNSTGVFFFNPTPTGVLVQETGKTVAVLQQEQLIVQQVFQTQAVGQQFLQAAPNTQHAAGTQIIVSDTLATDKSGSGIKTGDVSTTKVTISDQDNSDSTKNQSGVPAAVHPPIANADINAVVEAGVTPINVPFAGTPIVTGNVLANDLDPDVGNTNYLVVSNLSAVSAQLHGTITIGSDGNYTYTLNNNNPLTQALAAGETAVDVYSYVITNAGGYTSTSTLSITITGTDDAPIIAPQETVNSLANSLSSDAGKNNWAPKASADGHFIAYDGSDALPVPGQNTGGHVYFYNSITNTTALIDPATSHAGELFSHASISFDGRYVAFEGDYTDQSGARTEIFVFDRDTNQTTLLADPTTHTTISGANPTISANGQFIAMEHGGNEIVVADRNGTIVSTIAANGITDPVIDASGRFIAFQTSASLISVGNSTVASAHTDGTLELYVYDRAANTILAVAALEAPAQNPDSNVTIPASVSVSAGTIAFASDVNLLGLAGVVGNGSEVYVAKYDQASQTYTYTLVSAANNGTPANGSSFGAQVSPDGSYVTFSSTATNLVPGADSGQQQTYVYNLQTNTIQLVSAAADGTPGTGASSFPAAVALGGGQVVFGDTAANLVPGGGNGASNIFLVDLSGGTKSAVTEDVGAAASTVLKTNGALAFSDVDLSDSHIVSVAPQSGALGTLTATVSTDTTGSGTGGSVSWAYQVTEGAAESLGAFETHVDTFLVTVNDQHGGTSTQTVTVTIIGTQPLVTEPIFWTYTAGGDFHTPLNWSSDSVPGAGDDVGLIDHTGTYAVTSSVDENVRTVSGIAGTTLEIAAGLFTVTNGTGIGGNSGAIAVDNGAALQFWGTIDNAGLIALNATYSSTQFRVAGDVTLTGHGQLTLSDSGQNAIVSNGSAATLTNVDNTISGAGAIGDANLTLINQASGIIDANGQNALTLTSLSLSNSGTLEATGAELDLINSTVTNTGTVLATGANATIKLANATVGGGAMTVAGATDTIEAISGINFINNAAIANAGLIEASGGTLTIDPSTVANTGTLEAAANSLLIVSDTTVSNAGGIVTAAGSNATINLENATINGGTISTTGAGAVIEATVGINSITGAATIANGGVLKADGGELDLSNETVTNTSSVGVANGSTLKLNNVTITGGTITDNGTIDVTGASTLNGSASLANGQVIAGAKLTLDTVTVNGTAITDNASVQLDGAVKLTGGASIGGGPITNLGTLEAAGAATLANDTLTNTGSTLQVDAGQTLTLNGTTITGGTITDNGAIDVTGSSTINGNASLSNGQVTADAKLTLDSVTVSGTAIADNASVELDGTVKLTGGASIGDGPITNLGTLDVAGAATLANDTLANAGATLQIDAGQTLALNGTTITGGSITDNGIIAVTGASTLNGNASLTNGQVTVAVAQTLTLDNVTVSGSSVLDSGTVKVGAGNKLTLKSGTSIAGGAVTNLGTIAVSGAATLTNDMLANVAAALLIDANQTLALAGTTISGGTITDNGAIDVTGSSTINGNANVNNGQLAVAAGQTLTLDATVTGSTIIDSGTVKIDGGNILALSGISLTGGATSNAGTIDITGDSSISNDSLNNISAALKIEAGQKLILNGTTITGGTIIDNGAIDVTGSSTINGNANLNNGQVTVEAGQTLTLDNVTVTGTTITDSGTVKIDGGNILALSGVSLTGGNISNAGTIDISGNSSISNDSLNNISAALKIEAGQTLTLNGTTITGGTIIDNGAIDVTGSSTINGNANLNNGQVTVEAGQTLTLDNVTVTGTTITDNGIIQVTVSSTISGGTISIGGTGVVEATAGATLQIDDPLSNFGLLEANGAIVIVNGAVTGTGSATIQDGGTLVVGSSFAQTINFSGSTGTLTLDHPGDLTGHIGGLALGDIIDFADVTIKNAVIGAANGGSILTVTESNNQTATYQIAGSLSGNYFNILSDNAGGSDLVLTQTPPSWAGDTLVAYTQITTNSGLTHLTWQPQYLSFTVPTSGVPEDNNTFFLSFDDTGITASNFSGSHTWDGAPQYVFDGFVISDQTQSNISGVTIDPSTNMAGLTLADITFTSNTIKVNWGDLSYTPSTVVKLDVTFDPQIDSSQFGAIPTIDGSASPAVNAGTLTVADGTALALAGVIDNTGTIAVDALNAVTGVEINGNVTLQGGGHLALSQSNQNYVFGNDATLTNVGNTISGSGDFGNGSLVFHNAGVVEALGPYALIIDTGAHDFVNTGTLETGGGTLMVHSPVTGGGSAIIAGGTLEFFGASDNNVTFAGAGLLALDQSQTFTGNVSGFGAQDQIDLSDIAFSSTTTLDYVVNGGGSGGVLTVSDGTHTANLAMLGDYSLASFNASSDEHGGTTLATLVSDGGQPGGSQAVTDGMLTFTGLDPSRSEIASFTPNQPGYIGSFTLGAVTQNNGVASVAFDFSLGNDQIPVPDETLTQSYSVSVTDAQNPAAAATQTVTVSIGGVGNDDFVFHPGIGTATVVNFNSQVDMIELDGFANAHTVEQLQSLISTNAHGDAVIYLGHSDSITLSGTTLAQLQHVLTTAVLLH